MIEVILWIIYSLSSFGNFNGKMAKIHFWQVRHGSFLSKPGMHKEVGLSFISPSSISLFREFSKMFRLLCMTQHLKKPPFSLQSFAKLDCSWKILELYIFCNMNSHNVHTWPLDVRVQGFGLRGLRTPNVQKPRTSKTPNVRKWTPNVRTLNVRKPQTPNV